AGRPEVLLKSDQEVPYGLVVQVMAILKDAGVDKLGLVTVPPAP
ncbi:MAG: biopolymer transporter ExbD, partial [Deltaproteobacteria bacterium]|nr:biopolymer transporter ExbD [Deltaproteobacteria bacterium]